MTLMQFKKAWLPVLLLGCFACLLAGCVDEQVRGLEYSLENMNKDIEGLRKQIKALEVAVLTLNKELDNMRSNYASDSQERNELARTAAARGTGTESVRQLLPPQQCTCIEFEKQLIGMSTVELEQLLGQPNKKTDMEKGASFWVYDTIPCKNSESNVLMFSMQVAFEAGRVDRAAFSENVEYQHQPPAE